MQIFCALQMNNWQIDNTYGGICQINLRSFLENAGWLLSSKKVGPSNLVFDTAFMDASLRKLLTLFSLAHYCQTVTTILRNKRQKKGEIVRSIFVKFFSSSAK